MPNATVKFLEEGLNKLEYRVGMTGEVVSLKRGAIQLKWEEGVFTFVHFGTLILKLNMRKDKFKPEECIEAWHIQSQTDARYIIQSLAYWNACPNADIGYGSVNGNRFRFKNENDEWEAVPNEL